jgi:hypothetical protein
MAEMTVAAMSFTSSYRGDFAVSAAEVLRFAVLGLCR